MNINVMNSNELTDLVKALGWDKESELAALPNYCGIDSIKYIYHNNWADPEIEYKGKRFSVFEIEDCLWYEYTHDDEGNRLPEDKCPEDKYPDWVLAHKDYVESLCENLLVEEVA